jgi:hypothetical protein
VSCQVTYDPPWVLDSTAMRINLATLRLDVTMGRLGKCIQKRVQGRVFTGLVIDVIREALDQLLPIGIQRRSL